MRNLILFLSTVFILSCSQEPEVTTAVLSGRITNPSGENIMLTNGNFEHEIKVLESGTFLDTIELRENYYTLKYGREYGSLYLKPGYELNISFDANQFDETIDFIGSGEKQNKFLAQKVLVQEENLPRADSLYKLEEAPFMSAITNIKNALLGSLEQYEFTDSFKSNEQKNIEYDYLASITRYPSYHAHYAQKEGFTPSDAFLAPLKSVNFDNREDFERYSNYRSMVIVNFNDGFDEEDSAEKILGTLDNYKSQDIKDELLQYLKYYITSEREDLKALYDGIMLNSADEEFKAKLTEKYEKVKLLTKGNASPKFDYADINGKKVALDDLKGKLVYVDVWAQWCGPCKREIPFLKVLEKEYHDEPIEFVSISVDKEKDKQKWLDMVADKELKGIQLIADKDFKSDFIQNYAIDGIPRFILIDKEGNIVSADAPRPSTGEKIRTLIDENLASS